MKTIILVTMLSLAVPAIGGDVPGTLVLETGITIENVTTRVNDGMVWVTFPDGHMEAYSTEDVDLEASGLVSIKKDRMTEKPEPISMTKLADAKSPTDPSSSTIKITDADVEHVVPEDPEEGKNEANQGPLVVSDISHSIVKGRVNVTGTVTNTTIRQISKITVAVVAIGFDGPVVGKGNTRLAHPLGPKKATKFSLLMTGATDFKEIKAQARGTAAGTTRPSQNPHSRP